MTSDAALSTNLTAEWHGMQCLILVWRTQMVILPLYRHDVFIEAAASVAHVPKITEYECLVDVKSAGNDVLAVFSSKPL